MGKPSAAALHVVKISCGEDRLRQAVELHAAARDISWRLSVNTHSGGEIRGLTARRNAPATVLGKDIAVSAARWQIAMARYATF